jgi:hypothetical protein
MTTPLSRAIEVLSTPNVRAAEALRSLLVVSKRLEDEALTRWIRSELDGYSSMETVPDYRKPGALPITLTWHGYGGSQGTTTVTDLELPEQLRIGETPMRQPIAELEELAAGKKDAAAQLPTPWLALYRRAFSEGKAPGYQGMQVNYASQLYPRTMLRGAIDRVKTSALDLALDLEAVSPEAGSVGGPTTSTDPQLHQPVNVFLTTIYGAGATVTIGDEATVATGKRSTAIRLQAGDVEGMLRAASAYLNSGGVDELRAALDQDGGQPGERTRGLLTNVLAGAGVVVGGVTGNAAYDGLIALLGQVFPGFTG